VAAITGMVPRRGDIVCITDRAAKRFAEAPVARFRVLRSWTLPDCDGWCRIRGWDLDTDPQEMVTHDLLVNGLIIIAPGTGWHEQAGDRG
jgi:hypothetical protein